MSFPVVPLPPLFIPSDFLGPKEREESHELTEERPSYRRRDPRPAFRDAQFQGHGQISRAYAIPAVIDFCAHTFTTHYYYGYIVHYSTHTTHAHRRPWPSLLTPSVPASTPALTIIPCWITATWMQVHRHTHRDSKREIIETSTWSVRRAFHCCYYRHLGLRWFLPLPPFSNLAHPTP